MENNPIKDLSDALIAPSELEAEAELIKFAYNASNVGYWVWDQDTGILYLSDVSLKMLQLSKSEFSGNIEQIKALIHPEDYEPLKTALKTKVQHKQFFEIQFRAQRADGSYIWINIDGRAAPDGDDHPHRVGGSTVDASAYIGLKQGLQQEQDYLRLIFDNVPARIWLKDAHNKIIRLNEKAADSMNMPVEDVEGADTYDLFPEMAKAYHEADLVVINSGKPVLNIVEKYTPIGGSHGWVSTDKLPFTHPKTSQRFVLVISTDITQQKEYENQILQNTRRLDQANKDLDHFAYMASHDLKAPLRGMEELTKWIEEDLGEALTPDIKHKIDLLRGRVNRMDALLKDILAFSRAGKHMADPEAVKLSDVVDEVTEWLSPLGRFKIVKESGLPTLNVPRSALEHIILNLLSNAIKHHDKSEGTITIGGHDTDDYHVLFVADDGPGILAKYQIRVFEIFKQLKPRDAVEGSGIGLSIVKKMTEALGGKIEILSKDGKRGTRFNIYIPKG